MSLPWLTRIGGTAVVGAGVAAALWRRRREDKNSAGGATEAANVHQLAVIGGGVVGASIALNAARAGLSVVLLERGSVGSGATGLSAGTVYCEGPPPPHAWVRSHADVGGGNGTSDDVNSGPPMAPANGAGPAGDEGAAQVGQLADEHLENFLLHGSTEIIRAVGARASYVRSGCLTLARTEDEVASLIRQHNRSRALGYVDLHVIDGATAEIIEPGIRAGRVLAALHTPHSGHCEPAELVAALAEDAARAGADIRESVEILDVVFLGGGSGTAGPDDNSSGAAARYALRTDEGEEILADRVAVACGAWPDCVREGLGLGVPVVPVRGTMWLTAKLPTGSLRHVIYTEESHLAFEDPARSSLDLTAPMPIPKYCTHDRSASQLVKHAYGRQRKDGRVLFGGDRIRVAPDDFAVDAAGVERHRDHVAGFLSPIIMATAVEGSWAGLMPFALDGEPIVGELSRLGLPGLWVATGFGPDGIMKGPMVGKLVAEEIAGVSPLPTALSRAFDPCRPSGGVTRRGADGDASGATPRESSG